MKMLRQGDVQLIKIASLPAGAKKIEGSESKVLAYGEVTGHAHMIDVGELFRTENGELFLKVDSLSKVSHGYRSGNGISKDKTLQDGHKPAVVEPGIYRVDIKRQYSPTGWEKVQD